MPELPPVTSTFLPRSPGSPTARDSAEMVSGMTFLLLRWRCREVGGPAPALHRDERRGRLRLDVRGRRGVLGGRVAPEQQDPTAARRRSAPKGTWRGARGVLRGL